jgi:outer membrane lipopolysaccharide assembly protein LptE/RlpB
MLIIQGCSANGFHLRKSVELPTQYQTVQLLNLPAEKNDFQDVFENTLEEAGGRIVENSSAQIIFSNFQEGKRVIAYTSERKAREYLLYLKFEYAISYTNYNTLHKLAKRKINIDRSFLYDPDFALGKAEEEKQVQKILYQEASRLILLRLQYSR